MGAEPGGKARKNRKKKERIAARSVAEPQHCGQLGQPAALCISRQHGPDLVQTGPHAARNTESKSSHLVWMVPGAHTHAPVHRAAIFSVSFSSFFFNF